MTVTYFHQVLQRCQCVEMQWECRLISAFIEDEDPEGEYYMSFFYINFIFS